MVDKPHYSVSAVSVTKVPIQLALWHPFGFASGYYLDPLFLPFLGLLLQFPDVFKNIEYSMEAIPGIEQHRILELPQILAINFLLLLSAIVSLCYMKQRTLMDTGMLFLISYYRCGNPCLENQVHCASLSKQY